MVSLMIVVTLSNSTFSSWPPVEASWTFFACCIVLKFEVLLDSSWVLASVLLLFCFCFNSTISVFNAAISFDWFFWFVFHTSLVGDLDLLLECFEVKDRSFCCNVGLSAVGSVFWLILLLHLYYSLKCLHMLTSGYLVLLWFVMFFDFFQYQIYALSNKDF